MSYYGSSGRGYAGSARLHEYSARNSTSRSDQGEYSRSGYASGRGESFRGYSGGESTHSRSGYASATRGYDVVEGGPDEALSRRYAAEGRTDADFEMELPDDIRNDPETFGPTFSSEATRREWESLMMRRMGCLPDNYLRAEAMKAGRSGSYGASRLGTGGYSRHTQRDSGYDPRSFEYARTNSSARNGYGHSSHRSGASGRSREQVSYRV